MMWQLFQNASYTPRLTAKIHICVICDIFNTVYSSLAMVKKQGLTGSFNTDSPVFGFEQSDHLQMQVLPGNHKLRPIIDYLSSVSIR